MVTSISPSPLSFDKQELAAFLREIVREVVREELDRRLVKRPYPDVTDQCRSSLGDLRNSEFFRMWRDRTDLPDSSVLARELREQAWRRGPQ